MKIKICTVLCFSILAFTAFSQEQNKGLMHLSLEEAETILLKENLLVLAERLEIPQTEALVLQAKVWPNPTLTVDEVNLWATEYQRRNGEALPGILGSENFGKYRQISAQLEQLVETAGKRKKRIALAEVSASMAQSYLKDFLLSLKTEFRKTVYAYRFHQNYAALLEGQLLSLESIVNAYQKQYDQGNVNKAELIRLQASLLGIKDDWVEEKKLLNTLNQELIVLLNLPEHTTLSFDPVFKFTIDFDLPVTYTLAFLQQQALSNRPDLELSKLEVLRSQKELAYEKATAVPDVTLSVGYDRGGNIMQDFIGVGFSVDLPFFDRNKGMIKKAQIAVEQQEYRNQNKVLEVRETVRKHYKNVLEAASFFKGIKSNYLEELDAVMEAYTQYFKLQSINIITYMDFLESYIDTKKTILENQKEYLDDLEDLKYNTGIEL